MFCLKVHFLIEVSQPRDPYLLNHEDNDCILSRDGLVCWGGYLCPRDFFIQAGITLGESASQPRAAMPSERLGSVRMGSVFPDCLRLILITTHMHAFPALFLFCLGSLVFAALLHGSCGCRGSCSSLFSCFLLVTCFFCAHCKFDWR